MIFPDKCFPKYGAGLDDVIESHKQGGLKVVFNENELNPYLINETCYKLDIGCSDVASIAHQGVLGRILTLGLVSSPSSWRVRFNGVLTKKLVIVIPLGYFHEQSKTGFSNMLSPTDALHVLE